MSQLLLPQQRWPSIFGDGEPVVQGRALLPGARVSRFGDTHMWDFNGVLKRPANLAPSEWKVLFGNELEDPYWNLLAREFLMITFNQQCLSVLKAGVSLGASANPRTLPQLASRLRTLVSWARRTGRPPHADAWTVDDLRQRITDMVSDGSAADTVRGHVSALKNLALVEPALSLPWPVGDPWPGQSAREVAKLRGGKRVSTPTVPPSTWFPLIRAAWAYIHTFAPDVLRADQQLRGLRDAARVSRQGFDQRLAEWLADAQNLVPTHTPSSQWPGIQVNWKLLALVLGYKPVHSKAFNERSELCRRRRAMVLGAVAKGRTTTNTLTGELVQVVREDGSTGPWHPGIDPEALFVLKAALRNAAFVLVVGLSMMRDSEIYEIMRGAVVEHYSTPAISSTKIKGTANRPGKHWWVADPIVEALAIAEAVSLHDERVFAPAHASRQDDGVVDSVLLLAAFVKCSNAGRAWSGLDEIPTTYIRPHMFRRTMAMLTDQFPGSEIATGIQLKHVAARALANTTTRGYAASDADWVKYLTDALDNVKFRKIKNLYQHHTAGEEIGFGPGAERVKDAFDQITATVKARNGDARTADALLRTTRIHIRFGMLNNCTADHTNPVGAVCLENAIVPEGHVGPLDERCRPDRCANSMIGPEHLPIYDSHQRKQLQLINNPSTPPCRRDLAERELDITRNVHKMAGQAQ
ncbi:integrase [Streptomyces sp. CB02959]|uniref:integrase n=1 Tax=Streptomyces sp. CB02959 TaxID=2020330 RepID=UPI000C273A33|nr:integrase [Streptomyces sp. CB02959]PJN35676.1 integrase [Streptomyces sp. CB02959]